MKPVRALAVGALFFAGCLVVTLVGATTFLGVPRADLAGVALLLGGAGGGVGAAALLLLRPAVLGRLGGVRGYLVGAGLVGSLLLLGMVLAGAQAMFISEHDRAVLLTMLLFASLLAVGFSLYGGTPLARRVERLRRETARLAGGDLGAEVPEEGRDELAALAGDFNRTARALAEASAREKEAEKARRELIAAVSHDLRTPFASAQALIEAVADGVVEETEVRDRYLKSARSELEKLGRLVDDLVELSRLDAGALRLDLEEASLRDLISDTLAGFTPQARKKSIQLLGEVSEGADTVLANPPKLQRILYNLVSNALRHTPSGGAVVLRAELVGEVVRVEVSDSGEGISPKDLPRVFERSFMSERSRSRAGTGEETGAGLGLAIARGLVEAHGGEISVQSRPGYGSFFRFTLRPA